MATRRTTLAAIVLALLVVAGVSAYVGLTQPPAGQATCSPLQPGGVKSQTTKTTFGAVTQYLLPGQDRWPNAVTTAPDGSVWFAEQAVPGVAHLFPGNGTVVEYAWPGYKAPKPPDCAPNVSSSGIAIWNGMVWAADEFGSVIWGVNPGVGTATPLNVSGMADFPYWLAPGPDGALWFTSDNLPARLGRILTNMTVDVIDLKGMGSDQPLQLDFVNSSLAYLTAVDLSTNSSTHACQCDGHVYSFEPADVGTTISPVRVGGDHRLELPTSASYSSGSVWVAQHGAASVARYDVKSGAWTTYPTSRVGWVETTLPLMIAAAGGSVWFNEHYANKIGRLNPASGTLTEYSESSPPASGVAGIQNDLSIAPSPTGLWFTSLSGNYVGFVDGTRAPAFTASAAGSSRLSLTPGGTGSFNVSVSGSWSGALGVNVSDSEVPTSAPQQIRILPAVSSIPAGGTGPFHLGVEVQVGESVQPGSYTVAVTVTGGGVQQTAYVFVDVG